MNEQFTCKMTIGKQPGKRNISFKFYYSGQLRLQSKEGEALESDKSDGTKFVEWKFTTSFNRIDNGG